MIKRIISTMILGVTLAVPVTGATLLTGQAQETSAAQLPDLTPFYEDHNVIDVQSWNYTNGKYVYRIKYDTFNNFYSGAVRLEYPNSSRETETVLFWKYYDVMTGKVNSMTIDNKTLRKDNEFYLLEIEDDSTISSVNAKFYVTNPIWYEESLQLLHVRNTNTNNGNPSLGSGYTINQ